MGPGRSAQGRMIFRMMVPLAIWGTAERAAQSFGREDSGMSTDWGRLEDIAIEAERSGIASRMAIAVELRPRSAERDRWALHGDEPFLSASTIKVAILIAVARAIDRGELRHGDRRSARPIDTITGSGVLKGLEPGLSLTIDDHAWLMIAISDNTASNVLIEAVGLDGVRAVTEGLHLAGTHLRRPFLGVLPSDDLPRNQSTAGDLVTMLAAIVDDRAALPESCRWMRSLLAQQQHVERLGRDLPDGVSFAGKSGSLSETVHDAAILDGPDGKVIIAVLTSGVTRPYDVDAVLGKLAWTALDLAGIAAPATS